MKIHVIISLFLFLSLKSYSQKTNLINIEIPTGFKLISEDSSGFMYQNKGGVTMAVKYGKPVHDFKDVQLISVFSVAYLSKSLTNFNLEYEEKEMIINNKKFCLVIYTHDVDNENLIVYFYNTLVDNKLVSITFGCSTADALEWKDKFGEIINEADIK